MNGFNNVWVGCGHSSGPPGPIPHPQYAYVPYNKTAPYFAMAKQYVLADQMYASNIDGSFVSHQYIVAGQGEKSVDYPLSAWGCDGGSSDTVAMIGSNRQVPDGDEQACFADTSLGEEADDAGVTWADYTGAIWHQANR